MALPRVQRGWRSAVAAVVIAGAAFGLSARANAQEITANTNCTQYGLDEATRKGSVAADGYAALCEIQKGEVLRAEGKALRAEGKALSAKEQGLDKVIACLTDLKKFKENNPAEFAKLGPVTEDNACVLSGRIQKPTAGIKPTAG